MAPVSGSTSIPPACRLVVSTFASSLCKKLKAVHRRFPLTSARDALPVIPLVCRCRPPALVQQQTSANDAAKGLQALGTWFCYLHPAPDAPTHFAQHITLFGRPAARKTCNRRGRNRIWGPSSPVVSAGGCCCAAPHTVPACTPPDAVKSAGASPYTSALA